MALNSDETSQAVGSDDPEEQDIAKSTGLILTEVEKAWIAGL